MYCLKTNSIWAENNVKDQLAPTSGNILNISAVQQLQSAWNTFFLFDIHNILKTRNPTKADIKIIWTCSYKALVAWQDLKLGENIETEDRI